MIQRDPGTHLFELPEQQTEQIDPIKAGIQKRLKVFRFFWMHKHITFQDGTQKGSGKVIKQSELAPLNGWLPHYDLTVLCDHTGREITINTHRHKADVPLRNPAPYASKYKSAVKKHTP